MDKLEQYVDQVCRSIGGPRSLRQHVRQELREHLLDAKAQHQAAGLPEDDALDRALAEFGKPEDMRSELEATHGHRMLAVVIDKAMQWKEMTMRAKWLWTTWAYLGLAVVIGLEVLFITFTMLFIAPKYQKLLHDGLLNTSLYEDPAVSWVPALLVDLFNVTDYATLWLMLAAVAAGFFEWRVKSENKPLMRLSALGTVAVALLIVAILSAGSLMIAFCYSAPGTGRLARQFALDQVSHIDTSTNELEQAIVAKDWNAMQEQANFVDVGLSELANAAAIPALKTRDEPATVDELRAALKAARDRLGEVQHAIRQKDEARLVSALEQFRKSFRPVREAAKRPER